MGGASVRTQTAPDPAAIARNTAHLRTAAEALSLDSQRYPAGEWPAELEEARKAIVHAIHARGGKESP